MGRKMQQGSGAANEFLCDESLENCMKQRVRTAKLNFAVYRGFTNALSIDMAPMVLLA